MEFIKKAENLMRYFWNETFEIEYLMFLFQIGILAWYIQEIENPQSKIQDTWNWMSNFLILFFELLDLNTA